MTDFVRGYIQPTTTSQIGLSVHRSIAFQTVSRSIGKLVSQLTDRISILRSFNAEGFHSFYRFRATVSARSSSAVVITRAFD